MKGHICASAQVTKKLMCKLICSQVTLLVFLLSLKKDSRTNLRVYVHVTEVIIVLYKRRFAIYTTTENTAVTDAEIHKIQDPQQLSSFDKICAHSQDITAVGYKQSRQPIYRDLKREYHICEAGEKISSIVLKSLLAPPSRQQISHKRLQHHTLVNDEIEKHATNAKSFFFSPLLYFRKQAETVSHSWHNLAHAYYQSCYGDELSNHDF